MCALGLWCETPAASGPPGLHTTTPELQTCTFDGRGASKHHQKNHEKTHSEKQKRAKLVAGDGKKNAKFWALPPLRGPTLRAMTHTRSRNGLAQIGLAKTGLAKISQIRMAKTGLAKVGPFLPKPPLPPPPFPRRQCPTWAKIDLGQGPYSSWASSTLARCDSGQAEN